MDVEYRLEISTLFERQLAEAARYIREEYDNSTAAERLTLRVNNAINKRLANPLGYPVHWASPQGEQYRYIVVRKYIVFYTVTENIMDIRFIFHGSRDLEKLLDYD